MRLSFLPNMKTHTTTATLAALLLALCTLLASPLQAQKISDLTAATSLNSTDLFELSLNGAGSRKITASNLATSIGSLLSLSGTYQPLDATLTAFGGLTIASGKVPYGTGSDTFATVDSTSFGRSLLNAADASALRTLAATGDVYQPLDATLTALGGATITTGKIIYGTGSDTVSTVDSTSFGRSLLNAADASALRTLAELGGYWQTDSNNTMTSKTVPDLTGDRGLMLRNIVDASNLAYMSVLSSGNLSFVKQQTGWSTLSQFLITVPHGDGLNVGLSFPNSATPGADAGSGKLAIYPSISGNGSKVLAVNSGATAVEWVTPSSGVTDADYITKTANAGLSAEFALGSLATGLLKVTTTTGDLSSITNSSGLAGSISDETGSGALVFGTSPTISGGSITGLTTFGMGSISSMFSVGDINTFYTFGGTGLVGFRSNVDTSAGLWVSRGIGLGSAVNSPDVFLQREAADNFQLGVDGASAANQTVSAADKTGTNAVGPNFIVQPGNGTGTGGSGALVVQTAPASTSGTTANTFQEVFKIDSTGAITLGQTVKLCIGSGSPESVVTANVGSLYLRTDGGANTTLYIKESGTGNTGWTAK